VTRRSRGWRVVAAVFTVVNVGGAAAAILAGEPLHAAVHVGLLVATYVAWRLVRRARRLDLPHAQPVEDRLEHLQQSLDAIALEVERIGEAQRYAVKIVVERARSSLPKASE
jgi:hypothetical protein